MRAKEKKIDPITFEVIRGGLVSMCWEMGIAMERSAYSPVFSEGLDYSYAMFDSSAEMIAQAAFDPCHLGAMPYSARACVEEFGLDNVKPGDILLENDPYKGGSHISDFTAVMPVFYKGEVVAMPAARGHQIDVGAIVPGGMAGEAQDIFQEGLRIPPIRVNSKVSENEDIWKLILANVRLPVALQGDLRAMFGALRLGERRISQLVEKYGLETWKASLERVKDVSEAYMREEIRKITPGSYQYEDYIDDSGRDAKPAKIRVNITVSDDGILADYTGSSPQVSGPINASFAVTAGNTIIGVLHSLEIGGEYLVNQGTFRPIKVVAPKGSIVNPNFPGPVQGGNTELSIRIVDTVIGALSQGTSRERIKASCHGTSSSLTFGGIHPETGEQYINYLWGLGGQGGRAAGDGNSAMEPFATNNKGPYIEINEVRFPILHEEYSFTQDSAGPGKFRGGIGTKLSWKLRGDDCELSSLSERHLISPYGVFGGLPPMPNASGHFSDTRLKMSSAGEFEHADALFHKPSPSKWSNVTLRRGAVVELSLSGGGGWGDPLTRNQNAVLNDFADGFVSREAARDSYGVVIDRSGAVDSKATNSLRRSMRKTGVTVRNKDVKFVQTVLFKKKRNQDARYLKRVLSGSAIAINTTPTFVTVKLFGSSPGKVATQVAELEGKLGKARLLTAQFVPKGFVPP